MRYRSEIDGLRAVAVVAVILYHAKMTIFGHERFAGGFVGVDIFFVISGYLISKIIFGELQNTGKFNFLHFYERRARRILPVLFTVMLVSMPFAYYLLLPSGFVEYAKSILVSIFFGSNFFFYDVTSEYGAASSLLKPFLHTWSLSVEEQFYLFFPLIAICLYRYCRRHTLAIIAAILLLSLQFSDMLVLRNPELNFYFTLSRIWELLAGTMIALFELYYGKSKNHAASQIFPLIGIFLIIHSIAFFSDKTPHPSFITLMPVLGAVLIIYFSDGRDLVGRFLSLRVMVFIGLISYSLYLWHFPVFAFMRIHGLDIGLSEVMLAILATFIFSVASFYLIERPFRDRSRVSLMQIIGILFVVGSVLVASSLYIIKRGENLEQFPELTGVLSNYEMDNKKLQRESWDLFEENSQVFDNPKGVNVLIVGNSHAKDLYNAFMQNQNSFKGLNFAMAHIQLSCFARDREESREFYESELYSLSHVVIISSRLMGRVKCKKKEDDFLPPDIKGLEQLVVRAKKDNKIPVVTNNTVEFSSLGGRTVSDYIILEGDAESLDQKTPDEIRVVYSQIARKLYESRHKAREETIGSHAVEALFEINEQVKKIADSKGALFLDKYGLICRDEEKECFGVTENGEKIFYDYGHFTLEGAKFLGKRIVETAWLEPLYERLRKKGLLRKRGGKAKAASAKNSNM